MATLHVCVCAYSTFALQFSTIMATLHVCVCVCRIELRHGDLAACVGAIPGVCNVRLVRAEDGKAMYYGRTAAGEHVSVLLSSKSQVCVRQIIQWSAFWKF